MDENLDTEEHTFLIKIMDIERKKLGWYLCKIYNGQKKSLWCHIEEKCLGNTKIFFDGVFLSIYSHRKKIMGL